MLACVSGQAGKYAVLDGVYLDGRRTVYENVADYAGIRHAYGALQATAGASMSQRGSDGLTREQRFFVAYAQSHCSADTPDSLRDTARNDVHATARFRVNAPLSNLPAFARTFSCAKKVPMVRPAGERCRAW
jgi:endothelin-converting enzyme/putative endopeptidase